MNYNNKLSEAITLTQQMLEAAEADNWEQVIQIEGQRSSFLHLMDEMDLDAIDSANPSVIDRLKFLISLNEKVSKLCVEEKSECFSRFSSNKKNKRAFDVYTGY